MIQTYDNAEAIEAYIKEQQQGAIMIGYELMPGYPGMAFSKAILFNLPLGRLNLDLQWISFGLDPYGENLLENYTYNFNDTHALLQYLQNRYGILPADIPVKYTFNDEGLPSYFKEKEKQPLYREGWEQFKLDFHNGNFLDPTQELVFSTQGNKWIKD